MTFGACDTIISHYLVNSFGDLHHVIFLSFWVVFFFIFEVSVSQHPAIHNQGHYALGQETNSGPALLVQMVIPGAITKHFPFRTGHSSHTEVKASTD